METPRLPWKHCILLAVTVICLPYSPTEGQVDPPPSPPSTPINMTTLTPTPITSTFSTTPPLECHEKKWMCSDGTQCVWISYRCDGDFDCRDRSDEHPGFCADFVCDENDQFDCVNNRKLGNSTTFCIPISYLCDADDDCGDGSDQLPENCRTTPPLITSTTPPLCDPVLEFHCPDATDRGCIPINLKCDTLHDCKNGEDEDGCVYENCTMTEFRCHSGQCISKSNMCDGVPNCKDASDEATAICDVQMPTCDPKDFQCNNGKCMVWYKVLCNGVDDCGDNSDETICRTFNITECKTSTIHQCSQGCEEMTFGYRCTCKEGFKLDDDAKTCIDIDECKEGTRCPQRCTNLVGTFSCKCTDGYKDDSGDGKTCVRIDDIEPYLILGNKYYVRKMNFDGSNFATVSAEHTYTHVLDYHYEDKVIYYADAPNMKQTMKMMNFDGSGKETIERHHVVGIEGIAVDWIGRNVYWTSNKQRGIFVSRHDGKYVKVLLHDASDQPRAIAAHPQSGFLFWSDWSLQPFIGKVAMDGTQVSKVVTTGLFWPNGLTIDYQTDTLWWVDAHMDQLETCMFDGTKRKVIMTNLPHPYAVTVFENYVFWTEWNLLKIERANRYLSANRTTIRTTLQMPYDIHVVHPLRQPKSYNPCESDNGGCTHLCLLAPGANSTVPVTYTCACPENFILQPDLQTCKINCSSGHYVCKGPEAKCISKRFVCDAVVDCEDGDDEDDCDGAVCDPGYFQCGNTTQCIPNWRLCDETINCKNGADEAPGLCDNYQCMSYEFKCASGQCIPMSWECDGDNDCADASDEQPDNLMCTACNATDQFKCTNGKCIPLLWKCDFDDDCGDLSDEPRELCFAYRQTHQCADGWKQCKHNYRCIPTTNLCDGNNDCRDNSDEDPDQCPKCPRGDFQCLNGTPACIPERWKCDFRHDCAGGSDEEDCKYRNCSESEYRCNNQKCIRFEQKCDGIDNCRDGGKGSDEIGCPQTTCSPFEFSCKTGFQCLSYDMVCDGKIHCDDASDETICGTRLPTGEVCFPGQFICKNKACIPSAFVCDGEDDCKDNSDETRDACATLDCTGATNFKCNVSNKCIQSFLKCNGHDDCGDNSDEKDCDVTCYEHTQFTCPSTTRGTRGKCIPLRWVCDGINNCEDLVGETNLSADEVGCVKSGFCTKLSCQHSCTNITEHSSEFHKCECDAGYIHARHSNNECEELNECSSLKYNTCPHNCINNKGSYKCTCASGFVDRGFGRDCLPNAAPSMIYSLGNTINKFTPRTSELTDVIMQQRKADAVTVDLKNNIVYWTDPSLKKIYRSKIPTKLSDLGKPQELGISQIGQIEDIAYDWMGDNLFYIDSQLSIIGVTRTNWKYIKTIQRIRTANVLKSLAVNSEKGLLFWSEFAAGGELGAIRTANMSGFGRQYKIVTDGLVMPASLTIDYYMDGRLYWIDRSKNTIESAKYDGSDYMIIANVDHHPYSIDLFGGSLFFTTQSNRQINEIDKFGQGRGTPKTVYLAMLPLNDIYIMSKQKYPMDARLNRCAALSCTGLCIPEPGGARCICPDGWRKNSGGECIKPRAFRVLSPPTLCTCNNGGTCVMFPVEACRCTPEYTGRYCHITVAPGPPTRIPKTPTPATKTPVTPYTSPMPVRPKGTDKYLVAAIVAPIMIAVIILGLVGLIVYWLYSRGRLGKLMSGHGEVRTGRPGMRGNRAETAPPAFEPGAPIQREISFEEGAVRFSNPIYDTTPRTSNGRGATTSPRVNQEQDINTNYKYATDTKISESNVEPLSIAEAVSGLSEVHLNLPTSHEA